MNEGKEKTVRVNVFRVGQNETEVNEEEEGDYSSTFKMIVTLLVGLGMVLERLVMILGKIIESILCRMLGRFAEQVIYRRSGELEEDSEAETDEEKVKELPQAVRKARDAGEVWGYSCEKTVQTKQTDAKRRRETSEKKEEETEEQKEKRKVVEAVGAALQGAVLQEQRQIEKEKRGKKKKAQLGAMATDQESMRLSGGLPGSSGEAIVRTTSKERQQQTKVSLDSVGGNLAAFQRMQKRIEEVAKERAKKKKVKDG